MPVAGRGRVLPREERAERLIPLQSGGWGMGGFLTQSGCPTPARLSDCTWEWTGCAGAGGGRGQFSSCLTPTLISAAASNLSGLRLTPLDELVSGGGCWLCTWAAA